MMLHHEEDQLLMVHPSSKSVVQMDLNRGDVISEWRPDEIRSVQEIVPENKYAPQSLTQTVVGINGGGVFLMDPRLPGSDKIVEEKSFFAQGSEHPGFLCGATTSDGEIVLGAKDGSIRLYDKKMLTVGKPGTSVIERSLRAKTTFTSFGDPIKGVDVTHDGKWIIATCKTYLLLIKAYSGEDSGFAKSLGKRKTSPRRLRLKPADLRMIGDLDFTPAKFDLGDDNETSIVTSSGPYLITWDFRRVKQNRLDAYTIGKLQDDIVADHFRFGDTHHVIAAMPDDVTIASREEKRKKKL